MSNQRKRARFDGLEHSQSTQRRRTQRLGAAVAIAAAAFCAGAPGIAAAQDSAATASSAPRTTGTKVRDATITTKVKAALVGAGDLSSGDIHVRTRHGRVVLTGSVPDEQQRTHAVSVVQQVDGVQHVKDQLTIRPK